MKKQMLLCGIRYLLLGNEILRPHNDHFVSNDSLKISKRDLSLDMVKGILIMALVWGHLFYYSISCFSVDNELFFMIKHVVNDLLFSYFYMQAFFVITGMCSNFNEKVGSFVLKQVKTLFVPAVLFGAIVPLSQLPISVESFLKLPNPFHWWGVLRNWCAFPVAESGLYWFLTALFFGKIVYYFLHCLLKQHRRILFVVALALSLMAACLNDLQILPNYFWHRHVFDAVFFIAVGHIAKSFIESKRYVWWAVVAYVLSAGIGSIVFAELPRVTGSFTTTGVTWPCHIMLSVFGTMAIIGICKRIKPNKLIVFFGQNSMVIYMTQMYTL